MRKMDLTHICWEGVFVNSYGTQGCYKKFKDETQKPYIYYKMSNYDVYMGVVGHEAINEIIVYRLGAILGIPVVDYILVDATVHLNGKNFSTYLTQSKDYKKQGETGIRFDTFYELHRNSPAELPLNFLHRLGFADYADKMFLLDFLTIQRDRHGANIEVLKRDDSVRLAPLFDNGISFVAPLLDNYSAYSEFDAMRDVQANNFVGSLSLFHNLNLISKAVKVNPLRKEHRKAIFYGLSECMPKEYFDKIWEIIVRRYDYAKDRKVLICR